ncbi:MAG: hypothetical protein Q4A06_06225 [Cardiobacteriaceae bacterium]|nr:hypothetical protein [Cardiobacteriaceae bacterium]
MRQIFNDNKAPFFQFAHAMDFPVLGKDFTDFLADIYEKRTGKILDRDAVYQWFGRLEHIPLHMRTIIQNMILNPELSLDEAANYQKQHLYDDPAYSDKWLALKAMDQRILHNIAHGKQGLYSEENRKALADSMGVDEVTVSQMQAALRRLQRDDLITKNSANQWAINHPDMEGWIKENT